MDSTTSIQCVLYDLFVRFPLLPHDNFIRKYGKLLYFLFDNYFKKNNKFVIITFFYFLTLSYCFAMI